VAAGGDAELMAMATEEIAALEPEAEAVLEGALRRLVTADDRAIGSVMLEVRAGAGGDEAGLWAADLVRMYEKFAALRGWTWEQMEVSGEGAGGAAGGGVRSAIVSIR